MTLTIDIPESIVREAETRGTTVEALVQERLTGHLDYSKLPGATRFGRSTMTPAEAGADILELQKGLTLGGEITIRQLIEEGRRY